jgi:hypothetical protein
MSLEEAFRRNNPTISSVNNEKALERPSRPPRAQGLLLTVFLVFIVNLVLISIREFPTDVKPTSPFSWQHF